MAPDKKVISVITWVVGRIGILYNIAGTLSAQVFQSAVFVRISWTWSLMRKAGIAKISRGKKMEKPFLKFVPSFGLSV
jgi:hypothetical protein